MPLGLLAPHTSPKMPGVVSVYPGGVSWIISMAVHEAEQDVDQLRIVLVEALDFLVGQIGAMRRYRSRLPMCQAHIPQVPKPLKYIDVRPSPIIFDYQSEDRRCFLIEFNAQLWLNITDT